MNWQLLFALLCVAWAAVALIRRGLRLIQEKSSNSCGALGCDSCPVDSTASPQSLVERPLVSLQTTPPSDE